MLLLKRVYQRHAEHIKLLGLFLLISAVIAGALTLLGVFDHFNKQWIDTHVSGQGDAGMIYFVGIIALATAVSLPRQVAAFTAGYAFGVWQGTLLATLAAALGCALTYTFARFVLAKYATSKLPQKVAVIAEFLGKDTVEKTVIIRLLPAGNNFVLNLCAGVAKIHAAKFIGASYVGYFPQMTIFALAGSGLHMMSSMHLVISALLALVASVMSYRLYRKYQQQLSPLADKNEQNVCD